MLAPDVDIFDLDGRHLAGWLGLALPPGVGKHARYALIFLDDGVPLHAVGPDGPIDVDELADFGTSARDLARVQSALEVDLVVVLESAAVSALFADIEGSLRVTDDYPAQWITILRALKRQVGHGLWLEPRLLDLVPPLSADALQRTFDLLIPDKSAVVAYVMADSGDAVDASVIAVKQAGDVSALATHLGIADILDERTLARGWKSQYRRVLSLVEERYATPSLGVFIARGAWHRILTGPPDQLARELASQNLILDPQPTWLRALVGGAAAMAIATRGARTLARFIPDSARRAAEGLAGAAQDRLRDSAVNPFALLGFDPFELWHQVRRYYRPRRS